MLNAIQTLIDNGCIEGDEINELIGKCVDKCDNLDENRALILLAYLRSQGESVDPDDLTEMGDGTVEFGSREYLVLTDDEADDLCGDRIEDSLWAFNAGFLADMTDLPVEVFHALSDSCENSNDAVYRIVKSTCGIDKLVNRAACEDGRGHFLSSYDGEENEYTAQGVYFYIYRVN